MPGARSRSGRPGGRLRLSLRGTEAAALEALRAAASLEAATAVVCRRFERPGIVALPSRLAWARRALAALRAAAGPVAPGKPPGRR